MAAVVALLISGCAQGGAPAAGPGAAVIKPTPTVVSSPSAVADQCRFPVIDGMTGGFIGYPSGTFKSDPKGGFQAVAPVVTPGLQLVMTLASPVLKGDGGFYYDRAYDRWLPVSRHSVAPDGLHYAYVEGGFNLPVRLHIVNVTDGTESVRSLSGGNRMYVVDFAAGSIYLGTTAYEAPATGLYRLDLVTDSLQTISEDGQLQMPVAGLAGVIWFDDGGTRPETAPIGYPIPKRVVRLDLSTGARQPWFEPPKGTPLVLGVDLDGHPFVRTEDGIWLVRAPNDAVKIGGNRLDAPISDSHGTWFGDPEGVYLYAGGTLTKVSAQPARPANGCA